MSADLFVLPSCRVAVLLYSLLPLVATLGFCPRANVVVSHSLGDCRGPTTVHTLTVLFLDVSEPTEAGEAVEEENPEPNIIKRERHTVFVGNIPFGESVSPISRTRPNIDIPTA